MRTILFLAAAALLVIGCGQASDEAAQTESAAEATQETQEEAPAAEATTASTTISGELGCGHCNYEVGEGCSAAVKTADGTIYILDNADELFEKRFDGGSVEVVGVVSEKDGTQHVQVESYNM